MSEARLRDRRFRATRSSLEHQECRLCWRAVVVAPEHVETTDLHVYVRCPHCGGSFPIRHSDTEGFAGGGPPASG